MPEVASIGEIGGVVPFEDVLEEKYPGYTLENTRAAALYDGMLATPEDLRSRVVQILVLRLESVGHLERTGSIRGNEDLSSRLSVGPAGRAFRGLDERVETTFQVPVQDERVVGALTFGVVTGRLVGINADPPNLR